MKCQTKDRNSKPCRNFAIVHYCKIHSYMEDYTDEMKATVKLCSACLLWRFMGEYDTCEGCRIRGAEARVKAKETIVLCVKEGCKYKQSDNKYCGKHQADLFLEQTQEAGLKHCSNYLRGCRTQNELTYKFSRCAICLEKDRVKDNERRKEKLNEAVVTDEGKTCNTCSKFFTFDMFKGQVGDTVTCLGCRIANKKADEKRNKDHVNELARANAAKPERIAVKKEWKENNYDKVATYWIESRAKSIEENTEEYLKKNAENAKNWREANPEKVKEINKQSSENINCHYKNYRLSAESRRLEFPFTKEEFILIVSLPCYYCGIIQPKGFNGIDRLDSTIGYSLDNCRSCCEMCNMMKGTCGPIIFIHRTEHILTHLKFIEGTLYPFEFLDAKGCTYSQYKDRANKKNINFEISENLFYCKRQESCYLCGKEENETHKNGIDRFDNTKGYTEENIRSCCVSCNYMKKDYEYDLFINKLKLIYEYQKTNPIQDGNRELKMNIKGNKLTYEEKKEIKDTRKKEQRDTLREKYSNEETKKAWVSELVKKRKG